MRSQPDARPQTSVSTGLRQHADAHSFSLALQRAKTQGAGDHGTVQSVWLMCLASGVRDYHCVHFTSLDADATVRSMKRTPRAPSCTRG